MKQFYYLFKSVLFFPAFVFYYVIGGKSKQLIASDFKAYCDWQNRPYTAFGFCMLFAELREFRSICYKRLGHRKIFISWLWRGQTNLTIACEDIGPGFIVQHGYSTVIVAEHIGNNFHVNQCVNIVWNNTERPSFGSNVTVCAGAIVVGGVKIGDNVTIGAGAVVVKDVPDNCTVIGNPARYIIK